MCGVCPVTLQLGHRAIRLSCGQGRHVLHSRYVVEALARVAAPAPLRRPAVNCGAQHPRRHALEAAVQVDPGPRDRAERMGEENEGDDGIRSRGLRYGWDQNSLDIGSSLDAGSLEGLGQRLVTEKKWSRSC